jgi:hypothetical protein
MLAEQLDDIRPYYDSEIQPAMIRITQNPNFDRVVASFFPSKSLPEMREIVQNISTINDFQSIVMYPILQGIMNNSVSSYSSSDLQKVDKSKNYVFIANHRDIVLDALFLQKTLVENGLETTEVTFGSNLMSSDFIIDIGKSNKMFKVIRSASPKDFLKNSRLLSSYIRYTLGTQKHSIWIAQRNGRTKDGLDKTDQGLIKMLSISGPRDFTRNFSELNLLPISISYEYEPCDYLKVRELYLSKRITYMKSKDEDLQSIITGVTQIKGNIHLAISDPISIEELENIDLLRNNQKFDALAKKIDSRIITNYKLWNNNYIAFDILSGLDQYKHLYTADEKSRFLEYMNKQIDKISDIDDLKGLTTLFLELYANPVSANQKYVSS